MLRRNILGDNQSVATQARAYSILSTTDLDEADNVNVGSVTAITESSVTNEYHGPYIEAARAQGAANADTSGATLANLETEVNELKAALRAAGIIAP